MNTMLFAVLLFSHGVPAEHGDCAQLTQFTLADISTDHAENFVCRP